MILFYLSFIITMSAGKLPAQTEAIVPVKRDKAKEVIKVYQTPDNNGSITIQSANESVLSFYLFDLEGKMIYQSSIKQNEKQLIEGLSKGTYIYNAFQNDINLEGGKIVLK